MRAVRAAVFAELVIGRGEADSIDAAFAVRAVRAAMFAEVIDIICCEANFKLAGKAVRAISTAVFATLIIRRVKTSAVETGSAVWAIRAGGAAHLGFLLFFALAVNTGELMWAEISALPAAFAAIFPALILPAGVAVWAIRAAVFTGIVIADFLAFATGFTSHVVWAIRAG